MKYNKVHNALFAYAKLDSAISDIFLIVHATELLSDEQKIHLEDAANRIRNIRDALGEKAEQVELVEAGR